MKRCLTPPTAAASSSECPPSPPSPIIPRSRKLRRSEITQNTGYHQKQEEVVQDNTADNSAKLDTTEVENDHQQSLNDNTSITSNTEDNSVIEENKEVKEVKKHVEPVKFVSLSSLVECDRSSQYLGVGCPLINDQLGGGLRRGEISELVGESSSGKTQLSLQVCVEAAVRGEHVIYLETEAGFPNTRLDQMVEARESEDIRSRVLVQRIRNLEHLFTVLTSDVRTVFDNNDSVSLVIIDSVAALLRYDGDIGAGVERGNIIHKLGQALLTIALEYNVAVVAVNQVTDVVEEKQLSHLPYTWHRKHVSSLGAAWTQYPHTRLWLTKTNYQVQTSAIRLRTLTVDWSCRLGRNTVHWYVDNRGCHGVNIVD